MTKTKPPSTHLCFNEIVTSFSLVLQKQARKTTAQAQQQVTSIIKKCMGFARKLKQVPQMPKV